ncbi:hypothetical protein [Streptomyces sp. NPDC055681]
MLHDAARCDRACDRGTVGLRSPTGSANLLDDLLGDRVVRALAADVTTEIVDHLDKWAIKTGQMITYFYDSDIDGGFTYWPDGPDCAPKRFPAPFNNTCILSDNSLMYHRRESNGPAHMRDYPEIRLESLLHHEEGQWVVRNGEREIARYEDKDMRSLFHYTALVFDDLLDVRRYLDHTDDLTHERVLGILMHDLKQKGISFPEPEDPMKDADFIALLNATYAMAPVTYPAEAPVARRGAA